MKKEPADWQALENDLISLLRKAAEQSDERA